MPTKSKSPNGSTFDLSAYRLPSVFQWVECEDPDVNEALPEPLKVRVMINPPRAEIIALAQLMDEINRRADARLTAGRAARKQATEQGEDPPSLFDPEATRADDREAFEAISSRVVEWNLRAETTAGEVEPVPPPVEAGGAVIEILPVRAQRYLLTLVQSAHLGSETRSKLSRRPAATEVTEGAKTPSGPQVVSTPTTATHQVPRKNS